MIVCQNYTGTQGRLQGRRNTWVTTFERIELSKSNKMEGMQISIHQPGQNHTKPKPVRTTRQHSQSTFHQVVVVVCDLTELYQQELPRLHCPNSTCSDCSNCLNVRRAECLNEYAPPWDVQTTKTTDFRNRQNTQRLSKSSKNGVRRCDLLSVRKPRAKSFPLSSSVNGMS